MALRWPSTGWVQLVWGRFPFLLASASYDTFRRDTAWRWPGQAPVGGDPQLQFTGRGTDRISLEGTVHPHFNGGLRMVQLLRLQADQGEPQVLIDGRGNYYGRWAATAVEETQRAPMGDGAFRAQDFRLVLEKQAGGLVWG
ncbi:MAG: phage tail protein [Pseudomonadota bacterium]